MDVTAGGNSSKKRKICREEEEEEAKVEAFFALVRSMRETRDRWINLRSSGGDGGMNKTITGGKEENRNGVGVWKPTFQPEDFAEENGDPKTTRLALLEGTTASHHQSNNNNCIAKEEDAEKGIDLRLSL